jgi:hypothetical protein
MRRLLICTLVLTLWIAAGSAFAATELEVGSKAPDFTLTVAGTDTSITLSDFVDQKIVIVHFWKSK